MSSHPSLAETNPLSKRVAGQPKSRRRLELSIIAPMFNEEDNIAPFVKAVTQSIPRTTKGYEIILVDDGSDDETWERIVDIADDDSAVKGVSLSRNFGHQNALFAGMALASGRAIITMDGDLQHPPRAIPRLVQAWHDGFKVVNTKRIDSRDTSRFKQMTSRWFYKLFSRLSGVQMDAGSSDFRLLDRAAARSITEMRETDLFIRGLVNWLGFPTTTIRYEAAARRHGKTKFSLLRMLRFSTGALLSFSMLPLKLGIWAGFLMSLLALTESVYILVRYFQGVTVPGWASVMTFLSFMFAVLFVMIGIIGTYLGKIFEILKCRPRYVLKCKAGFASES